MLISLGLTTDWDETPSEHPICTPTRKFSRLARVQLSEATCGQTLKILLLSLLDTGLGALTPQRLPYKTHHGLSPSPYIQAGCPVGP